MDNIYIYCKPSLVSPARLSPHIRVWLERVHTIPTYASLCLQSLHSCMSWRDTTAHGVRARREGSAISEEDERGRERLFEDIDSPLFLVE